MTRLAVVVCLASAAPAFPQAALTIYNQDFAVVRDRVPLDLKKGENQVSYGGVTERLEPASVLLRDPSGHVQLQILEQNYRADPITTEKLLSLFEGKTIEFLVPGDKEQIVRGKVIRSGFTTDPRTQQQWPIIEVDGKLRFALPGTPLFPALGDDTVLKPELRWVLGSDRAVKLDAELAYITGGLTWSADYNIISQAGKASVDLIGWVTMQNHSGKDFLNARVKLMAGDVNKVQPVMQFEALSSRPTFAARMPQPPVTEKTFDEYHLYTLERAATLRDKETKQVEFMRAEGASSQLIYVYDGLKIDHNQYNGWNQEAIRNQPEYGTQSNNKVWAMREFKNSSANHLGLPLPAGRVRFYRRDADGQLEFTGEDNIAHTPKDETVRVFTGAAFDIRGERRRTNFVNDMNRSQMDEAFEITLRNHKTEPIEVRVVEHLYRWNTFEIRNNTMPFTKTDADTIEFRVQLAAGEEKKLSYDAHYTW